MVNALATATATASALVDASHALARAHASASALARRAPFLRAFLWWMVSFASIGLGCEGTYFLRSFFGLIGNSLRLLDWLYTRESIAYRNMAVPYMPTQEMVADMLTEPLPTMAFEHCIGTLLKV